MRKHSVGAACALAFLVASAFASAQTPADRTTRTLQAAIDRGCLFELGHDSVAGDLERLPVVDDVVHYRFKVRVGPGAFDIIRMHRVVKERRPFVKGFIPVDMAMKYEPGTIPDWVCPTADWYRSRPPGDYADDVSFYATLGALAIGDPSGTSPFYAPLTNEQAVLVLGTSPGGLTPTFHQVAGVFDETGMPTGLQFTGKDYFIHFMAGGAVGAGAVWWAPARAGLDQMDTWCDVTDVPFDDHLGDVRVPTLNLAAAGGFGQASVHSATLLGSPDVTNLIVSLKPLGEEALDFGHSDLWLADNADKLVWRPILDWLKKR